jgi:hypothetical protein
MHNDFSPRPIRCIDRWEIEGLRLKVYSIAYRRPVADDLLVDAARRVVSAQLREHPTRNEHHGVGFVGIHDGRGENQVFLDQWVNQNELLHSSWVSPKDAPAELLRPREDHNSVCVWDLFVQGFERQAWIDCVIGNDEGPDLEAYFARVFDGEA